MSHATLVDTKMLSATLDHMLAAVEASPIQDDPFPHIIVKEFFPTDTYSRLFDFLPPSVDYESFRERVYVNRKHFRLENACLEKLPRPQRQFWYTICSALGSVALKETVFHKLRSGLSYRFNCDPNEAFSLPGFALPQLFRETTGYRIKPHPDTLKKVVTMQIALPENLGQEHLGTEFYRRSIRPSSYLGELRGFKIVKTMPFLPNTAYAFVVLNTKRIKSWHGRSSLQSTCGVRNSLLNTWFHRAENANTEILEVNESPKPYKAV